MPCIKKLLETNPDAYHQHTADGPLGMHTCSDCTHEWEPIDNPASDCHTCFYGDKIEDCRFQAKEDAF